MKQHALCHYIMLWVLKRDGLPTNYFHMAFTSSQRHRQLHNQHLIRFAYTKIALVSVLFFCTYNTNRKAYEKWEKLCMCPHTDSVCESLIYQYVLTQILLNQRMIIHGVRASEGSHFFFPNVRLPLYL